MVGNSESMLFLNMFLTCSLPLETNVTSIVKLESLIGSLLNYNLLSTIVASEHEVMGMNVSLFLGVLNQHARSTIAGT